MAIDCGFGMCYAYQNPKIMRHEEDARKIVRKTGGHCFKCPECGTWHISKLKDGVKL